MVFALACVAGMLSLTETHPKEHMNVIAVLKKKSKYKKKKKKEKEKKKENKR